MHLLELDLQPNVSEVARACEALQVFLARHFVPVVSRRRLALVLDDALANLVLHALDQTQPISLKIELDTNQVVLVIADHAAPFDPLQRDAPDTSSSADDRPIGGLGIHLMRALMTNVQYGRDGVRNVLRFTLNLTPRQPGDLSS